MNRISALVLGLACGLAMALAPSAGHAAFVQPSENSATGFTTAPSELAARRSHWQQPSQVRSLFQPQRGGECGGLLSPTYCGGRLAPLADTIRDTARAVGWRPRQAADRSEREIIIAPRIKTRLRPLRLWPWAPLKRAKPPRNDFSFSTPAERRRSREEARQAKAEKQRFLDSLPDPEWTVIGTLVVLSMAMAAVFASRS